MLEFAFFVADQNAHLEPTAAQLKKLERDQASDIQEQIKLSEMKDASQNSSSKAMSEDAIRKRQIREQKKAEKDVPEPLAPPPPPMYNIVVPAESTSLSWYHPDSSRYDSMTAAKEAGLWSYPSNLQERAKCGIFRSLWEQGYFMGSGIKFGGDYLVYPGKLRVVAFQSVVVNDVRKVTQ